MGALLGTKRIAKNERPEWTGIVFQENPAVIVSVLKNLSAREIAKFSRVCRSWNRYGRKILEGRKWMCSHLIKARNAARVMTEMRKYLEKLPIIPRVVLFSEAGTDIDEITKWRKLFESMMLEGRRRLHPDCQLLAVGYPNSGRFSTSPLVNTFVFPTLPEGTHLISSNVPNERCLQLEGPQLSRADFNNLFAIPDQLTVRCVLIFATEWAYFESLCDAFWNRDSGQIAVCAGIGICKCSIDLGSDVLYGCTFVLAFCGANVSASSVVIGASEDPAVKLRLLEEHIGSLEVTPKQMFAFHFIGTDVSQEKFHVQCQQFHQMFGQTPVANVGTCWNYGHDYSPTRPVPPLPSDWTLPRGSSLFALVAII